jgi:hypothetical protein
MKGKQTFIALQSDHSIVLNDFKTLLKVSVDKRQRTNYRADGSSKTRRVVIRVP